MSMPERSVTEIGKRIKLRRDELGLSSRDVERIGGLANGMCSKIERGKSTRPAADTLQKYAKALDVTVEWLVGLEQGSSPTKVGDPWPVDVADKYPSRARACAICRYELEIDKRAIDYVAGLSRDTIDGGLEDPGAEYWVRRIFAQVDVLRAREARRSDHHGRPRY